MEITIDCTLPMEDIHNRFAEALDFPWWYGKNLDALYDLLTAMSADVTITRQEWYDLYCSTGKTLP